MGATRRAGLMSARDLILSAIRAAAVPPAPPATTDAARRAASTPSELREAFLAVLRAVGGRGGMLDTGDSAERAAAGLYEQGLPRNPLLASDAPTPPLFVVQGRFAVAENGAVYVDAADLSARNSIVLAEHLVVVVPFDAIVPTMHEAVRLMPTDSRCGWFLSGPSKTADIEQSLVHGAQGSRSHTVLFAR